ncbi:hypothetical protein B7486_09105 [cyanobacterium TDX16]|nr:hypothetical protein B7486_09105 [cyanobacterium TDX16]
MLDPVGSTSWHNRHLSVFERLAELLREQGADNPTILVIGPGGVTSLMAGMLNDSSREDASSLRKLMGDAARYSDQLLRRIPVMPLRSLEPEEIERTITVPHRLVVIDRSQRILSAVARQIPGAACHCLDVSFQRVPMEADVIVAFNVFCRLERPEDGLRNVMPALRPGGLLLIDDRSAAGRLDEWPDVRPVDSKIHRRMLA